LKGNFFVDAALAHRIESTDAWVGAESARMHAQISPECGAASLPIPGGCAVIRGMGSPRTQVLGLGMEGSVTALHLEEIEHFFRVRNIQIQIDVCPLADRSVPPLLASSGYTLEGFSNVLVRRLPAQQFSLDPGADIVVELCAPSEAELWAQTVLEGFVGGAAALEENTAILLSLFHQPGTLCLLARIGSAPCGAGALSIRDNVAAMYGASTIPAFRRKGVQSAMIQAIMRQAIDTRCEIIYTITEPGSTSQRNLERQDFRTAYTRAILIKRLKSSRGFSGSNNRRRVGPA